MMNYTMSSKCLGVNCLDFFSVPDFGNVGIPIRGSKLFCKMFRKLFSTVNFLPCESLSM